MLLQINEILFYFFNYSKQAQKCYCESYNCRGFIGATDVSNEVEIDAEIEENDDEENKKLKKDKSISKLKDEFEDLAVCIFYLFKFILNNSG